MSQNIKKQIDYLIKLTDKTGIIEHCCFDKPNYLEGYCTDDNARALQVCLRLKNQYPVLEDVLPIYFNFLKSAVKDNGCHNDLNQDLTWKNDCNRNSEHYGRALAALGELSKSENKLATEAKNIFDKLYSNVVSSEYVRIWSQIILGLKERQNYDDIKQWADLILQTYEQQKKETWQWFEPSMSYDNSRIPMSLLTAYEATKDEKYLTVALETLDFLTNNIFDKQKDIFVFPGNEGWIDKYGNKAIFDQQPIEAGSMTEDYCLAYKITKELKYKELALKAFGWYSGKNISGISLIDDKTGGIYDGLTPNGVNLNRGAESVLSYLLAYSVVYLIS